MPPDGAGLAPGGFLVAELSVFEAVVVIGFVVVVDDGFCATTGVVVFTAGLVVSGLVALVTADGLLTVVLGAVDTGFVGGFTFLVYTFSAVIFVLSNLF